MAESFTKLFGSIIHSSVWREPHHVRLVWITMLAMADQHGYVGASLPGLADAARVTMPEAEEAIARFLAPDKYSRSKEFDGRRVEEADRGWRILNYQRFRDMRDEEIRKEYERNRKRDQRARAAKAAVSHDVPESPGQSRDVPESPAVSAQAEAEAEAESEGSGSDPIPSEQSGSVARDPCATEHVLPAGRRKPFEAHSIGNMFGRIRAEILGGLHHNGPGGPVSPAKLADAAAYVNDQPGGPDSVEGSMRAFWEGVREGEHPEGQRCAKNAAFAFGSWFTGTFQAFHDARVGVAPKNVPVSGRRTPRDGGLAAFLAAGEKVPA